MEEFFPGAWGFVPIVIIIVTFIILVAAVLAFLLPFFILKIRNQVTSINNKMDDIIELLSSGLFTESDSKEFSVGKDIYFKK